MIIDCDTCSAQGVHCHDCVITVLLDSPPLDSPTLGSARLGVPRGPVELDPSEQIALVSLAGAGLVPPLRLVPGAAVGDRRGVADRDTRGIA